MTERLLNERDSIRVPEFLNVKITKGKFRYNIIYFKIVSKILTICVFLHGSHGVVKCQ